MVNQFMYKRLTFIYLRMASVNNLQGMQPKLNAAHLRVNPSTEFGRIEKNSQKGPKREILKTSRPLANNL